MSRRSEITQRARQLELEQESDLDIIHLMVRENAGVCGKTLKSIADQLPKNSLLVSLKRNGRTIIPHGTTVIEAGDSVTIIVGKQSVEKINQLFQQTIEE